jgi:hypothetical protein
MYIDRNPTREVDMFVNRYNHYYKPSSSDPKLLDEQVMVPMTYGALVAIVNALDDLHQEAGKKDGRLEEYPADEMEPIHTEIVGRIIPCLKSLEAFHASKE